MPMGKGEGKIKKGQNVKGKGEKRKDDSEMVNRENKGV
jgi:hypothetical protein